MEASSSTASKFSDQQSQAKEKAMLVCADSSDAGDADQEANQRAESLRVLSSIFPAKSTHDLERALLEFGGNIDTASDRLLEPARVALKSIDNDGIIEVVWPADVPAATLGDPSVSLLGKRKAPSDDAVSDASIEKAARELEPLLAEIDGVLLRQVLRETGNDKNAAMNKLLNAATAVASSSSSSMTNVACSDEFDVVAVAQPEESLQIQLERLLPDCDPLHITEVLQEVSGDVNAASERILSSSSYPKRAKLARKCSSSTSMKVTKSASSSSLPMGSQASAIFADEDEQQPPDGRGEEYWLDVSQRQNESRTLKYREEAQALLLDEFHELGRPGIAKVITQISYCYGVEWKRCYEGVTEVLAGREPAKPLATLRCPRKTRRKVGEMSPRDIKSKILKKEFEFVRWWSGKGKRMEERKQVQEAYLKECEAQGLLLECECCFSETLPELTVQCAAGHLFCKTCTNHYVDTQLSGEGGVPKLMCMSTSGCRENLLRSELSRVLPPAKLATFDQLLEKASLEAALVQEGSRFEKCPFCHYVIEMELSPEDNKIFVCHNEACGKESCRLCKEENHIPLRCEEVEKKTHATHRLTVEEAMTAAMIRECTTCKSKGVHSCFVKTDGCNRMTCPKCKGFVCYECNLTISKSVGYGHFCQHPTDPGKACTKCKKCPLWAGSTAKDLEQREAVRRREAAVGADEAYRAEYGADAVQERLAVVDEAAAPKKSDKKSRSKNRWPDWW